MMDFDANTDAAAAQRNSEVAHITEDSHSLIATPLLVTLHPAGRGKFTATLGGYPLVSRPCSSIIFAACRALVAAGASDSPAHFRHAGSRWVFDAKVRSIHAAAKLVALDRQRSGLRIEGWTHSDED